MRLHIFTFFIIAVLFTTLQVQAQNFYKELTPRDRQITVGIGPSVAYTDFSFEESSVPSVIHPSMFIAYGQQFRDHLYLVTTVGVQLSESNHIFMSAEDLRPFIGTGQSITYKTQSLFVDIMPQFNIWRSDTHVWRPGFQVYGGIGLGIIASSGVEQFIALKDNRTEFTGENDINRDYQRNSRASGYVPIRVGISKKIHPHWDLGLQGTYMYLFTNRFEGNNMINGKNDQLYQVHLTLKRYLPPTFAPFICY